MATGSLVVAICQYGGEFTSGPKGNLIYQGGEAHAVGVTHDMSLESFKAEVSKMFNVDATDMSVKYFLPNNNRTLITVSFDRELQRMVELAASAAQVDVFLVSREENRIIATQAGASISKPASTAASGVKRKRPLSKIKYVASFQFPLFSLASQSPYYSVLHSVVSLYRVFKNNKKTPDAPSNSVQATANIMKEPSPVVAENEDNRCRIDLYTFLKSLHVFFAQKHYLEFGNEFTFTTTTGDASSTPSILDQQKLALFDDTPREMVSMFDDAVNPYVGSEITEEPPQGFDNPIMLWDDIIRGVGQEFDNVKEFRAQLCKYAIGKGFAYCFIKNETSRVTVKCAAEGGCSWRLHASESSRSKKFVIKKMTDEHTCGGGSGEGQRRATRQWLTTIIKEKLHDNPMFKPKELVKELYDEYGVTTTYSQVWRGKEAAQKELYHAIRETYSHLPWPLLFLDKVPLKATNEYKLLVAAAVDADDGVFPVGFSVVEDETYESWVWFLMQLKVALQNNNYRYNDMTFLSSGQKGLDAAVSQVFEDGHHAFCLHHIMEEFKGELRKGPWSQQIREVMIEDFTRAAEACSIEDFNASIESIRNISSEAADWIIASKPEHWSDAIFRGCRYDHLSSNILDAFVIESRREACKAWPGPLTPTMEYKVEEEMLKAGGGNFPLTYSGTMFPIPDMDSVDFSAGANIIPPPKPRTSDKPRRKRSNPNKISTLVRLCSRCKQTGHNKATCECQRYKNAADVNMVLERKLLLDGPGEGPPIIVDVDYIWEMEISPIAAIDDDEAIGWW
ncbi:hypothetical protein PR202_ga22795 [Eleusine coracana subsp. coracana]|uniref:PB1 domain-containing protein n=1 Tax=Eleusine coracana subsp. coracana TaxID=191504 RepID=A0AAV5D416_ELECO|nr:hypothetical protein PR202_ga22795 [Eleusine coracana subsp. coracana]